MKRKKKQLPILKEFPWEKIRSFSHINPYAIFFCYPKPPKEPFILKGGLNDCEAKVKALNYPMMVNRTMWHKGHPRGGWHIMLPGKGDYTAYIYGFSKRMRELRYKGKLIKILRKVPRKWMKELDQFC